VTLARKTIKGMGAPLWRGAVVQRSAYVQSLASGQAVSEFEPDGAAAQEMRQLWRDVREAAYVMARRRQQAVA
jgi:chromosome partitioning protein